MLAFINNLYGMDSLVILVIALLIFGKRLPEVMRALGASVKEFKQGLNDPPVAAPAPAAPAMAPALVAPVAASAEVAPELAAPVGLAKQMP